MQQIINKNNNTLRELDLQIKKSKLNPKDPEYKPLKKAELEKMGYRIKNRGSIGRTEGILIGPTGKRITVADKRGDDAVAGY